MIRVLTTCNENGQHFAYLQPCVSRLRRTSHMSENKKQEVIAEARFICVYA